MRHSNQRQKIRKTMKKIYLVDASGFIFRAYHAVAPLTRADGVPVGAVYGFCNMLFKLMQQIGNQYLTVVFDAGRQTFRHEIYEDYKANRPPTPEDLIPQFALVRQACQAFGVTAIESDGVEADDLIASYTKHAVEAGLEVVIVSSDKDLMQLIDHTVSMWDPMKEKKIHFEEVIERFGVTPNFVVDALALAGDASDNVPGVSGIGLKTAADLINSIGTLEEIYENIDDIKQVKRRETLIREKEEAFISKALVRLKDDCPLQSDLTASAQTDPNVLIDFLTQQGFDRLKKRVLQTFQSDSIEEKRPEKITLHTPILVDHEFALNELVDKLYEKQKFAVDTETTSLDVKRAKLVGVSIATDDASYYIPVGHMFGSQLPLQRVIDALKPLLEEPGILKIGHNVKYDMNILKKYGLTIISYDDTMLLSYTLFGNKHLHNMDDLSDLYLGHKTIAFEDVVGKGKNQLTFDQVDIKVACAYAAEDADITYRLWQLFKPKLIEQHQCTLYETAERPMADVCATMEQNGILVDKNVLIILGKEFSEKMHQLEQIIFEKVGCTFNLASPKQLGEILFDKLQLPGGKKNKSGGYSTDHEILESLNEHEVPALILQWRSFAKLHSTYIEAMLTAQDEKSGRVHTSYSLTGTATGRFSSSNPNLQNIPVKSEDGRKIRSAFIASPGFKLLSLDYSQIELRLLAHIAKIDTLIKGFCQNMDIHALTASQIFNVPLQDITPEIRSKAKAVNFGIIYGISGFGLAKQLGCSKTEATEIIDQYFVQYPGIQAYMEQQKEIAQKQGYVETLFKRRCYTPNILDKNPNLRMFAQRQAINAPLQGSNADIMKMAMAKIHAYLQDQQCLSRLLLTVHDELVFDIHETEIDALVPLFKKMMEQIAFLSVPLTIDAAIADHWGAL
ncbi:MAG: DNA polymerase I [Holosporales bacterium]